MTSFSKYFDHTNLKPDATRADIEKLCREAHKYDFYSVCVNSGRAALAAELLKGSDVKTAAVTGFPLGAMAAKAKAFEARCALKDGAAEIDMVMNIGALKDGDDDAVAADIAGVLKAVREEGGVLKVILETCLLTDEQKRRAALIAIEAGADFLKTSTGFSTGGATVDDVALLREIAGKKARVKASGGIRTLETAEAMIAAGADRLGASASVSIMEEYLSRR